MSALSVIILITLLLDTSIFGENVTRTKFQKTSQVDHTGNNSRTETLFTNWTPWSKCVDCFQNRVKICVRKECKNSSITEERPCDRRKCQRWHRGTKSIHFLRLHILRHIKDNKLINHAKKIRPRIWSKWSTWSPCTPDCKTNRYKKCKKPGRCKKRVKTENAYCYYERSNCELYVFSLISNNISYGKNYYEDITRYQHQRPTTTTTTTKRPSTAKKRKLRCGRVTFRKTKMLKIIGGKNAEVNKWPWHVAVVNQFNETFCSGTLIAPRWVLTAGHCVRSILKVRLNEYDLRRVDKSEQEVRVQSITHPKFNLRTVDNDIALLRLPRAAKLPYACLPEIEPHPSDMCSIMGWGKLKSSDDIGSPILQEAMIPIVNDTICASAYSKYQITKNMFCAGVQAGNIDTCAGDSGGGLMCKGRNHAYTLQGITSFGDGCGIEDKYGIYTNVYNYIDWIEKTMKRMKNKGS